MQDPVRGKKRVASEKGIGSFLSLTEVVEGAFGGLVGCDERLLHEYLENLFKHGHRHHRRPVDIATAKRKTNIDRPARRIETKKNEERRVRACFPVARGVWMDGQLSHTTHLNLTESALMISEIPYQRKKGVYYY